MNYKKINAIYTQMVSPLNYIKYSQFKQEFHPVKRDIPIYIFYHLCPKSADNVRHLIIIDEQINELIRSGLYEKCNAVFYGCSCKGCDTFLENYLSKYSKFKRLDDAIVPNMKSYENMTINSMLEFAKKSQVEFYGLYLHTKGTSAVSETQNSWRQFMMYFLVANYKICLDILNRGFYTCGVNYLGAPTKHYAGNFFWFDSNYVKQLDYIPKQEICDRFKAEFWLFNKYVKNKHVSLYKERYISFPVINTGLYNFAIDYETNVQSLDVAII
jgi:hypothetical protein